MGACEGQTFSRRCGGDMACDEVLDGGWDIEWAKFRFDNGDLWRQKRYTFVK